MKPGWRSTAGTVAAVGALYAAAAAGGLALLCLAFKAGLLAGIDILFYRGLVLIALVGTATYGLLAVALPRLRTSRIGLRDAFAATAVSLSFNLSFLVVLPVTVDRSISLFLLAQMARQDHSLRADEVRDLFTTVYVGQHRQIERRLREQTLSGFLDREGASYRISAKGRRLVATSRIIGTLFDSHAGLMDGPETLDADLAQRNAPPSRRE